MDMVQVLSSEAFLTNKFGDRYLYSINRSVFNHLGSQAVYQNEFPELFEKEEILHILVGSDSGLLLQYMNSQSIPAGSKFLCVELPETVQRLESEGILQNLNDQIQCISSNEFNQVMTNPELMMNDYLILDNVELHMSLAASDAFTPEYRELSWNIQQMLEQKRWAIQTSLSHHVFVKTQLMNVAENHSSAAVFNRAFTGKTAVLLGGGPSLDNFLPWLKKNRDRVVVLAVSRISRRLIEVGLSPDFVFSVDPQQISFEVSREMLNFDPQTVFINSYHVSPPLLSQWRGGSYYGGSLFPWKTPLNIAEDYPTPGPTVTNTAFAAALQMGFSRVILAGVDLCFDDAGNSHAKGSYERSAGPQFSEQQFWVKTNSGKSAVTTYAMGHAVTAFGVQVEQALKCGCKVFNISANAAEIPNVTYLPVDELEENLLPTDAWQTIQQINLDDTQIQRTEHYKIVLAELLRAKEKLKQIRKLSNDGLKYNDGLFGRKGMKADFKYKIKMDNLEKKLNRLHADFMPLVKSFDLKNIIKITHLKTAEEWTDDEIEAAGQLYYESCRNSSEQLITLIDDAVERTRTRLEEESSTPDFPRIFRQWHKDNIPGRSLVLRERNSQKNFFNDEIAKKELEAFAEEFNSAVMQREISYSKRLSQKADPGVARGNALLLFQKHNHEGLGQLVSGLNQLESDEANRVAHLVKGYLAELNGDAEIALIEYQAVFSDAVDSVLEDALRRISILALGCSDFENAKMALQCLASISPVYLPQYANFSKMLGDVQQAVNLYADYLEQVPDDINTMLKLGEIYKDQGLNEGAETVFKTILEINPGNSAAQMFLSELTDREI